MNIEEHVVSSHSGNYSRKIWLLDAEGGSPERIGVFLDGEYYVNKMDATSTLAHLQRSGSIPPMSCIFVSHVNREARHHDLTCNPEYSDFIATDIIQWLRGRNNEIPERGHFIAGPSLGGLAAAYLALARPSIFSFCLSQSGSFWWKHEWLKNSIAPTSLSNGKFWVSVGDKETESGVSHPPTGLQQDVTQIAGCQNLAEALKYMGYIVHYNLYEGGHEIRPWKEELPRALCWLLE